MRETGAVVVGGHFQGLGILRSLASKKVPVCLLDHDLCIGRFSRYPKRFFKCPNVTNEQAFLDFLEALADTEGIRGWVIYPNDDDTVSLLSRHSQRLADFYRIPLPPWEVTRRVCEKRLTYELAEGLGLAVPKTRYPATTSDLKGLDVPFPAILKPSVKEPFYSRTKKKAIRVDTQQELEEQFERASSLVPGVEIMVQELIPSGTSSLYSVGSFFKDGEFLGKVVAQRIRQHPMDFGHATTYAETVDIPELEQAAARLLRAVDFYGLSEVEFMRDPRDGEYKILEINARPWGWHTLAIAAGVDLPYMLYLDMTGESVHQNGFAKNVKWMRLATDIPTATGEVFRGNLGLRAYLGSLVARKHLAVFSWKDPLPFFAELALVPYLWRRRGF